MPSIIFPEVLNKYNKPSIEASTIVLVFITNSIMYSHVLIIMLDLFKYIKESSRFSLFAVRFGM